MTETMFKDKALQDSYDMAKRVSYQYKKKLDDMSCDIRNTEYFLKKSGFGYFEKSYSQEKDTLKLVWDGKRLIKDEKPLIESKVDVRIESYRFLGDFLKSLTEHFKKETVK